MRAPARSGPSTTTTRSRLLRAGIYQYRLSVSDVARRHRPRVPIPNHGTPSLRLPPSRPPLPLTSVTCAADASLRRAEMAKRARAARPPPPCERTAANTYTGPCVACAFERSCTACLLTATCERCSPSGRCGRCRNIHSKAHRASGMQSSAPGAPRRLGASPRSTPALVIDALDLPRSREGLNRLYTRSKRSGRRARLRTSVSSAGSRGLVTSYSVRHKRRFDSRACRAHL